MQLETNIKNIKQIAQQKKDENLSFHRFLNEQDFDKIDVIVHRLNEEVSPQINCLECANCCQNLRPIATNEELSKYVEEKNIEAFKYLMSFSCKHLNDKACNIYLDRPEECRSYPYLNKSGFVKKTLGMLQNYEICPIVFNVFELLKTELGWEEK